MSETEESVEIFLSERDSMRAWRMRRNIHHGANGLRTCAGPSTSRQHRRPGSTPSKGSSPSSLAEGSSMASSTPSWTFRLPSTASS